MNPRDLAGNAEEDISNGCDKNVDNDYVNGKKNNVDNDNATGEKNNVYHVDSRNLGLKQIG